MEQVEEFLKHANECLSMASKAADDTRKEDFRKLARHWMTLAAERQKWLEQKQKQ